MRLRSVAVFVLTLLLAGCGGQQPPAAPAATPTAAAATPCVSVAGQPTPSTSIHLRPATGGPGTVVCVTGYVAGGPDAGHATDAQRNARVCWDGCRGGLTESVQVAWSSDHAGFFATKLTVPRTAWLTAAGPRPLTPGSYRVGVQCILPSRGCGLQPAEASATFRLTGPAPDRCVAGKPCAVLRLAPDTGRPGTVLHVSGWAPLTEIIGQPFGYGLVLEGGASTTPVGRVSQALDGSLTGTVRLPAAIPGGGGQLQPGKYSVALQALFDGAPPSGPAQPVTKGGEVVAGRLLLAPTPLTVLPAPTWASLGQLRPLTIQPSASLFGGSIAAAGANLAYCVPGGIRLSGDRGQTWTAVPDAGIVAAAAKIGYALPGFARKAGPTCRQVTFDPTHTGSLYATFVMVTAKCDCMPPGFMVGFATADGGRTWTAVPQPAGFAPEHGDLGFGGFAVQGAEVLALFGRRGAGAPTVEMTTDGGRTWRAGQLACPATGACVRWGPAPSSIAACMTEYPQPVEASANGGGSWASAATADLCLGTGDLVTFGGKEAALLSGRASFPLRLSHDGGQTWSYVSLPPLAGHPVYDGLMMLPDGSLLAHPEPAQPSTRWERLAPAATAWCTVPALTTTGTVTAADGRLWWLSGVNQGAEPRLHSLALSALTCR